MTGIVIFLCIAFSCLIFYIGYLVGVKYVTIKFTCAYIDALFECGVDPKVIENVIDKTKELLIKYIKEGDKDE